MIKQIEERLNYCLQQLYALVSAESLNYYLLGEVYEKDLANEETKLIDEFDKIAEGLPKEIIEAKSLNKYDAVNNYLISHYFASLITIFETFLFDLQKIILFKYPNKLSNITLSIDEIVEAKDKNEILSYAIDKYLNSISYKRPSEYKKVFFEILSAPNDFLRDNWPIFIEMKARRDIGVHNNWKVNDLYLRKTAEVGMIYGKKETFLFPTSDYFDKSAETISELLKEIFNHCKSKFVNKQINRQPY